MAFDLGQCDRPWNFPAETNDADQDRAWLRLQAEVDRLTERDVSDFLGDLLGDALSNASTSLDDIGNPNMGEARRMIRAKLADILTDGALRKVADITAGAGNVEHPTLDVLEDEYDEMIAALAQAHDVAYRWEWR